MNRLKGFIKINPIIVKEIRSRMRGPRAFIILTIILLAMSAVLYAILQIIMATSRYSTVMSSQIGQGLFAALAFLELFVIAAVTPSVTAGAISSEKEHQTYEMLMATPMSSFGVLWGKLVSALSYVLLLLFAAVPLASVVFIFGGVAPRDMIKTLLVLLVIAISFGILGLFMSTLFGRTGRATIASFIVVAILMFGPLFIAILITALTQGNEPPRWILAFSPISALSAALSDSMSRSGGGEFFYILGGIFTMGVSPISQTSIPRPLYHYSLPFYIILSLVLYLLSARLIQPTRRWHLRQKDLLIASAILVVVIGGITAIFFLTADRYEWAGNLDEQSNLPQVNEIAVRQAIAVQPDGQVFTVDPSEPTAISQSATLVSAEQLSETDQAEIYSVIIRQFYTVDHTFGDKSPNWPKVYILEMTDDGVGDPNVTHSDSSELSISLQDEITNQLSDLPAQIIWVATRDEVPVDPNDGTIDHGEGAIITIGNIHSQEDATVYVSASLYFGNLGATGKTYILSRIDGTWQITGTTGVEWIS